MPSVVFYMEDGTTLVHKLENEVTTIGRHPDSAVQLTCPSSSGKHAIIRMAEDGVYVQDLGSSNGTRVNGAEIEEAVLNDGDRVGFGDVQAIYYEGEAPVVAAPPPVPTSPPLPAPAAVKPASTPLPSIPTKSGRPLSPVRRAYAGKPGGYPDSSGNGCMSAMVVIFLFVAAFVIGLAMRHAKEMDGNLFTDLIDKLKGSVPQIKIEKKADE